MTTTSLLRGLGNAVLLRSLSFTRAPRRGMSMNCGVSKIGGIIRMFLPMPMSTFVQCGFVTLPQNPQQFAVQSVSFHRRARCVLNWTEMIVEMSFSVKAVVTVKFER